MPRRSRIMIIADKPDDVRMLTAAFELARWMVESDVIAAGHLAIDALRRNHDRSKPTDLVLLSSTPDETSCVNTLKGIKSHPDFGYLPVIVFSTQRPSRDMAHACSLVGALKYLEIPGDLSHWILLEMRMNSRFPLAGQLTLRDTWINSRPLAVVQALASP
jgi:response regulator RpfG family c-di-GMP phosphodiesterase